MVDGNGVQLRNALADEGFFFIVLGTERFVVDRGNDTGSAALLVQQRVELDSDFVRLGTRDVAVCAFVFRFHLGGRRFGLMVIEIEVPPPIRLGKTRGVFDGHVRAVELAREVTPSRRLATRPIGVLSW